MKSKRGQEAGGVYILLILMGLFILLYVILLPPADRAALLNETMSTTDGSGIDAVSKSVLLSESPGEVYSYSTTEHTITLEPMNLYSKEEVQTYNLIKSMTVSRNLLKDNYKILNFDLGDLADLRGAKLLFLITESKGPITIYLNNKLIYEGVLTSSDLPLELPMIHLQSKNKLEFYSASPGARIFSSNYYLMQDVKLLKTFKVEKKRVSRGFFVAEDIGQNINRASLKYLVNCNLINQRPELTMYLNSRKIFQDTIFCEYLEEREIPLTKTTLNVYGRNKLDVEIDKGDISIDDIYIDAKLGKSTFPSYSFEISNTVWKKLQDGTSDLVLRLKLDDGRKRANLYIQDEKIGIDTTSGTYIRDITTMVDNGANRIKIEPLNNFEILSLRIAEE